MPIYQRFNVESIGNLLRHFLFVFILIIIVIDAWPMERSDSTWSIISFSWNSESATICVTPTLLKLLTVCNSLRIECAMGAMFQCPFPVLSPPVLRQMCHEDVTCHTHDHACRQTETVSRVYVMMWGIPESDPADSFTATLLPSWESPGQPLCLLSQLSEGLRGWESYPILLLQARAKCNIVNAMSLLQLENMRFLILITHSCTI